LGHADLHIVPVLAGSKNSGFGKVLFGSVLVAAAVVTAGAAAGPETAALVASTTTPVEATAAAAGVGMGLGLTAVAGITYGQIAAFGAMMAFGGISQLIAPHPTVSDYSQQNPVDQRPSYIFNGPVNASVQGGPVPCVFGETITGSVVVYSGLDVQSVDLDVIGANPAVEQWKL